MCMQEGRIPKEWRMGLIVPIWKTKGDVHDPGKYRGITLLSQVMKLKFVIHVFLTGTISKESIDSSLGTM